MCEPYLNNRYAIVGNLGVNDGVGVRALAHHDFLQCQRADLSLQCRSNQARQTFGAYPQILCIEDLKLARKQYCWRMSFDGVPVWVRPSPGAVAGGPPWVVSRVYRSRAHVPPPPCTLHRAPRRVSTSLVPPNGILEKSCSPDLKSPPCSEEPEQFPMDARTVVLNENTALLNELHLTVRPTT